LKINQDTQQIVDFIEKASGGELHAKQLLSELLVIAASYSLDAELNDLLFVGSAVWNMQRALQLGQNDQEALKKTMAEELEKLRNLIEQIFKIDNEANLSHDLDASQLYNLAYDLHQFKKIQNKHKR
jgi:hypothetical protein